MIQHTPSHIQSAIYYMQELFCSWQIKGILASVAAFLGTEESLFLWLICMMSADLFFGLWEAFKRHKFSCRMLGRGIMKYPCYCLYIVLVGAVDASFTASVGLDLPLLELFISYLVATDAVSVMGHMIRCGLPVPKRLKTIVLHAQARIEHEIEELDSPEEDCKKHKKKKSKDENED